jgi:predicted unusual protein kinase regulating ubiquinone biosynthesis (AarF/ABC1/UbiB family)
MRALSEVVNQRPLVFVPQPFADYTTARVLTMEYVEGRRLTDLGPLGRMEVDGAPLADDLFRAYLDQVLIDGFFHADPHPGNIVLSTDGRLALLDVGMVARVAPTLRIKLARLLVALGESRGDEVARVMAELGTPLGTFDEAAFTKQVADLVARTSHNTLVELEAGAVVLELTRISGDSGLRPPPELSMLGKALLNLDEVARLLDPTFDPRATLRRHAADIARGGMQLSPGSLFTTLLDTKEFAEQLPGRVNRAMDAVANGQFELRVRAFDETELLRGVHKAANRVTTGLIIAALILGAALLSQVRSSSQILGYPSIAFVFFVIAACGGAWLVLSIVLADRRLKNRGRDLP